MIFLSAPKRSFLFGPGRIRSDNDSSLAWIPAGPSPLRPSPFAFALRPFALRPSPFLPVATPYEERRLRYKEAILRKRGKRSYHLRGAISLREERCRPKLGQATSVTTSGFCLRNVQRAPSTCMGPPSGWSWRATEYDFQEINETANHGPVDGIKMHILYASRKLLEDHRRKKRHCSVPTHDPNTRGPSAGTANIRGNEELDRQKGGQFANRLPSRAGDEPPPARARFNTSRWLRKQPRAPMLGKPFAAAGRIPGKKSMRPGTSGTLILASIVSIWRRRSARSGRLIMKARSNSVRNCIRNRRRIVRPHCCS